MSDGKNRLLPIEYKCAQCGYLVQRDFLDKCSSCDTRINVCLHCAKKGQHLQWFKDHCHHFNL